MRVCASPSLADRYTVRFAHKRLARLYEAAEIPREYDDDLTIYFTDKKLSARVDGREPRRGEVGVLGNHIYTAYRSAEGSMIRHFKISVDVPKVISEAKLGVRHYDETFHEISDFSENAASAIVVHEMLHHKAAVTWLGACAAMNALPRHRLLARYKMQQGPAARNVDVEESRVRQSTKELFIEHADWLEGLVSVKPN